MPTARSLLPSFEVMLSRTGIDFRHGVLSSHFQEAWTIENLQHVWPLYTSRLPEEPATDCKSDGNKDKADDKDA